MNSVLRVQKDVFRAAAAGSVESSAYGLGSSYYVEPDEDHMSVPFRIESRILRQLLESRRR